MNMFSDHFEATEEHWELLGKGLGPDGRSVDEHLDEWKRNHKPVLQIYRESRAMASPQPQECGHICLFRGSPEHR